VVTLQPLAAGVVAGILSNITGYVITGRLFHPYQVQTPNTWRAAESHTHYLYSAGVRVLACIGIAILYGLAAASTSVFGSGAILGAAAFGISLWAVAVAPVIIEVALFVNWHRGFVAGLLLDWLIVCVVASIAACLAGRVV
jgi:hypothetical protein